MGLFAPSYYFEGKPLSWLPLLSRAFVHIQIMHIFFNMYWLYFLGPPLEREFGSAKSLLFLVVAAITSSGWQLATGHDGIGFSGVGYAIIGFGWIARYSRPILRAYFNDRVLQILAGWAVLCIFLDLFHIQSIGNVAHFSGLGFGLLVGVACFKKRWVWLPAAAVFAAAFIPVYWNPRSADWQFKQATRAYDRKDFKTAERLFENCLGEDTDESVVWYNVALSALRADDQPGFERAFSKLQKIAPNKAKELIGATPEPTQKR